MQASSGLEPLAGRAGGGCCCLELPVWQGGAGSRARPWVPPSRGSGNAWPGEPPRLRNSSLCSREWGGEGQPTAPFSIRPALYIACLAASALQLPRVHSKEGAKENVRSPLRGQQGCECSGMRKAPTLGFVSCPEASPVQVQTGTLPSAPFQVSPRPMHRLDGGATPSLTPKRAGSEGKATKLPANRSLVLPETQTHSVVWPQQGHGWLGRCWPPMGCSNIPRLCKPGSPSAKRHILPTML